MIIEDEISDKVNHEHPLVSIVHANTDVIRYLSDLAVTEHKSLIPFITERIELHSDYILETSKQLTAYSRISIKSVK
jgi:hypothetical protein|tara:strand:+ start:325 stop:555 length:231 start_codon:yes stop_codon:yes gene_type:complete